MCNLQYLLIPQLSPISFIISWQGENKISLISYYEWIFFMKKTKLDVRNTLYYMKFFPSQCLLSREGFSICHSQRHPFTKPKGYSCESTILYSFGETSIVSPDCLAMLKILFKRCRVEIIFRRIAPHPQT